MSRAARRREERHRSKVGLEVKHAWPPNIDALRERFGAVVNSGTIFTYAPHVYVPSGNTLPPPLAAHERVHLRQQGEHPEQWWARYLVDDGFRLDQEIPAHRAEWRAAKELRMYGARVRIAARLAGPLYGSVLTLQEALAQIGQ